MDRLLNILHACTMRKSSDMVVDAQVYMCSYAQHTHVHNNTLTHGHVYTINIIMCTYMSVENNHII